MHTCELGRGRVKRREEGRYNSIEALFGRYLCSLSSGFGWCLMKFPVGWWISYIVVAARV